jgi:glycosyltransferase involved in cell wall biosynthesis
MRLSVGIPVYNEEAVVPELLARLLPVLNALPGGPHEVVSTTAARIAHESS